MVKAWEIVSLCRRAAVYNHSYLFLSMPRQPGLLYKNFSLDFSHNGIIL